MSKSPRAAAGASAPSTITLRASTRPLSPSDLAPEPDTAPPHTPPFKAFDWLDGVEGVDPLTRALVNDTINVCKGVSLVLRMVEQINVAGDLSPEVVTLSDGTGLEQPEAPYLDPNDCAALSSLAATAVSLLSDRAHEFADQLRRSGRRAATRTDC